MLILIRHGATRLNEFTRVQGVIDELLSDKGLRQSHYLPSWIQTLPLTVPQLCSSPAKRTMGTANIVATSLGLAVRPVPGIQERDFGPYEGMNRAELLARRGLPDSTSPDVIEQWNGVDGVETDASIRARVWPALATVDIPDGCATRDIIAVTHSGVIEVILADLLGIHDPNRKWIKIPPASGIAVGIPGAGRDPRLLHLWPNPIA